MQVFEAFIDGVKDQQQEVEVLRFDQARRRAA
jgi:hypothetical protein